MERHDPPSSETTPGKKQRVQSLSDKGYRRTNLARAGEQGKRHHGSAGSAAGTLTEVEPNTEFYLALLSRKLREGPSQPQPVQRGESAKSGGGVRKLGLPAVRERVCQQARGQRREPSFEPHFENGAFGSRQGRSPHAARRKGWQDLTAGPGWCVAADLRACFDTISQDKLVALMAEESSDGGVLHLLGARRRAGASEGA